MGIRVVVGDFERSSSVAHPPNNSYSSSWKPNPNTTDLYTITQHLQSRPSKANDPFATDVQAYGVVLLEMLIATTQHNHHHHNEHYQAQRMLETPSSIMTCTESQLEMMSTVSGKSNHCACSIRVTDIRAHKEIERFHGSLPFIKASHQRGSLHSVYSAFHYPMTKRSESATHDKDSGVHDCNNNSSKKEPIHSTATSTSEEQHDQIRSTSRPTLVLQVPDSSESESDSMVEVRTRLGKRYNSNKQILTNGSFISANRNTSQSSTGFLLPTKFDVGTSTDDLYNSTYVNKELTMDEQNLTPIYEDEEVPKTFTSNTSVFRHPRLRSSAKGKYGPTRRRMASLPSDNNKPLRIFDPTHNKRNSLVSLDESVISADSGVGSSHYDTGSTISDQSSLFNNLAVNRDPFYGKYDESDVDNISMSQLYNMRNRRKPEEDGTLMQNCDIQTDTIAHNQNTECENIYEKLPDFITGVTSPRRRKQPCVGHHKHVNGVTCTHSYTQPAPHVGSKGSHISKYEQSLSVHPNTNVHATVNSRECCHQPSGCNECSMELLYKKHVIPYVDDPTRTASTISETDWQHTTSNTSTYSAPQLSCSNQHTISNNTDPCINCSPMGLMPMLSSPSVVKKATIRNVVQSIHDGQTLSNVAAKVWYRWVCVHVL